MKKSWISRHPYVVIGCLLVACLGPFLNKAIHADDPLFVWTAQWIQHHPTDFFGFQVNWWFTTIPMWVTNCNPPLMSYCLAGVGSLFGWSEVVLHLAGLAIAFAAATGIYSLARMWCERPLLATVVAIFTPAFLVSSTTLMCDVLMLAFWVWALVFWERALAGGRGGWQFVGAGVLAGLAVLTKYSAITLLPLLPILSLLRTRKLGWWLLGLAVPLVMVAGYEWITAQMYGKGLLSAAAYYARAHPEGFPGGWKARGIISLAFAGGSLLPLLFFAPWLWHWRTLLMGSAVILSVLLGIFQPGNDWGLNQNPDPMNHWNFLLQLVVLLAGGIQFLLLTALAIGQRRDATSVKLVLWIVGGLVFATALNWTINARSFLLIVPPAAILLARRLSVSRSHGLPGGWWWLWPMIPAAAIAWGAALADCRLADSARTAAKQITEKYKTANHQLWFEGHGGCQFYMEKLGGQPIDLARSSLAPGDVVVVPWINYGFVPLPAGSVGLVDVLEYCPHSWMNVAGGTENQTAGFYGAYWGPVPFAIGQLSCQPYYVLRVCSPVQFNTQPTNPREVLAGDIPGFARVSSKSGGGTNTFAVPEVQAQVELAHELEREGNITDAIQHYRQALKLDPNDVTALNDLAWTLTTASRLELRNGEEAVRLAEQAVELTHASQPVIIGTLAAACAQTGRFPKAVEMATLAHRLALITGQQEIAGKNARLLALYSAGLTADALGGP